MSAFWKLPAAALVLSLPVASALVPGNVPPLRLSSVVSSTDANDTMTSEMMGDSCSCLPWSDVYATHRVLCGQGFEFFAWFKRGPIKTDYYKFEEFLAEESATYEMICETFFKRLQGNHAVRMKYQTPTPEAGSNWDASWCYVSPECNDLNGGAEVPQSGLFHGTAGTMLGVKIVKPESDDVQLRKMNPNHLIRLAARDGVNLGLMLGFAYYSVKSDEFEISLRLVDSAQRTGLTTVVEPGWHKNPRMIVEGNDRWIIHEASNDTKTEDPGTWWVGEPFYAH